MIVSVILWVSSLNAKECYCSLYYYVLLIQSLLLYRILIPICFPASRNILGRASLCVGARALYRALVRPEGRAFLSEYWEPKTLHQAEPGTKSPAQLISTSDADEPPQKCVKARSRLLSSKLSEDLP